VISRSAEMWNSTRLSLLVFVYRERSLVEIRDPLAAVVQHRGVKNDESCLRPERRLLARSERRLHRERDGASLE
jgi:hypothetical protein